MEVGSNQLEKAVTLTSANTLTMTPPGTDKLKMKIKTKTGLFSGSFVYPNQTKLTAVGGVLFQDQTIVGGFWLLEERASDGGFVSAWRDGTWRSFFPNFPV